MGLVSMVEVEFRAMSLNHPVQNRTSEHSILRLRAPLASVRYLADC